MMRLDPALSDEGPNGEESVTTVDLGKAMRQESRQLELPLEDRGEAPKVEGSGEAGTVAHGDELRKRASPDAGGGRACQPRRSVETRAAE